MILIHYNKMQEHVYLKIKALSFKLSTIQQITHASSAITIISTLFVCSSTKFKHERFVLKRVSMTHFHLFNENLTFTETGAFMEF